MDESKQKYDYDSFDLDEKINLIKKTIDRIVLSRIDGKLHIEIYNKYNDNMEHIVLVRKWRNWVISND